MSKSDPQGPTLLAALVAQARAEMVRAGGCALDSYTWERAIGARIASRSSPEQLRDGVLTLRVSSSVWAQELSLLSSTIIDRLSVAGFDISSIRCRVAPLDSTPKRRQVVARAPIPVVELPADLTEQLERIADVDLRTTIERAARSQLQRKAQQQSSSRLASATTPIARAPQSVAREIVQQGQTSPDSRAARRRSHERPKD